MQTHGVFRPNFGGVFEKFGPRNLALFDFPMITCRSIDWRARWNSHDGHQIESHGHLAGAGFEVHGGLLEECSAGTYFDKNH